jgi:tetratricopeptide (TPR) repeat protein
LEIDARYGGAWYNKGGVLMSLGRYSEALTCYIRTLEIDPLGGSNPLAPTNPFAHKSATYKTENINERLVPDKDVDTSNP